MNRKYPLEQIQSDPLDCFGEYRKNNPLCGKYCALRLSCAIEHDQNMRMELIEDLVSAEGEIIKIQ